MRLIDADALKKEWHLGNVCETCGRDTRQCGNDYCFSRMDVCGMIDDAPTVDGWISVKEVASIIADLFGDKCACNNNGIDEWLPKYCEYRDTDCPYPPEASCWEQYLKHLSEKPVEVKND